MPDGAGRVLRLCLDVNILVSDALAAGKDGPSGASSRIVAMIEAGSCALGPVQLVVSWRMLTTLHIVLVRLGVTKEQASSVCDLLAEVAGAGPLGQPPSVVLSGTGLLPLADAEDVGVLETAFAGRADLLVSYDLGDFEAGPRSRLPTRRLLSDQRGRPAALLIQDPLRGDLLVAAPNLAVGWLRSQTVPPVDIAQP